MKKLGILLVLSLLGLGLFSACASNADTLPGPSPMTSAMPTASPMTTMGPTVSLSPAASPTTSAAPTAGAGGMGVNTVEDARRVSEDVQDEVEKLSEVKDAETVVAGNIALVGLEYDAQYQGGLTERLMEMVKSRVETIDKTVTTVHVTDDKAIAKKISDLEDKLEKGDITFEELQTQMLDIGSGIAGGGNANVTKPQTTKGA